MTNPFAAVTPAGSTGSGTVPVSTAAWPLPVVARCRAHGAWKRVGHGPGEGSPDRCRQHPSPIARACGQRRIDATMARLLRRFLRSWCGRTVMAVAVWAIVVFGQAMSAAPVQGLRLCVCATDVSLSLPSDPCCAADADVPDCPGCHIIPLSDDGIVAVVATPAPTHILGAASAPLRVKMCVASRMPALREGPDPTRAHPPPHLQFLRSVILTC